MSELGTGLDSGLNARDWVNSETEESCLTNSYVQKILALQFQKHKFQLQSLWVPAPWYKTLY
jgi:hypothetical protein